MLKDVKNILFGEIKEDIEKYEEAKSRIDNINLRLKEIKKIMGWGMEVSASMRLQEPHKPSLIIERFSFFDKWIFKRKQYLSVEKLNKEAQEKYKQEMEEYNQKCDEYSREFDLLEKEKKLLEIECKEIEERGIRDKFEKIKNGKTLKDIDISFEEAEKLLKAKGIKLVLDESDKEITINQSEFDKPEDFILVHKTKYAPVNDELKSNAYAGAKYKYTIDYEEEEFSYEYLVGRNTVHLCQNGEVSSHVDGNFDGRKYAVLIPFTGVKDSKRLASFSPQDTFFNEKVDIIEGYILCPVDEVESVKKENPKSYVIGYEGKSVDGFADAFLSMIGYRREEIGMHSWQKATAMEKHAKFIEKNSNLKYATHAGSKEAKRDDIITRFNKIIGFIESIINSRNDGKRYDVEKLTRLVSKSGLKVTHETEIEKAEVKDSWGKIGPSYTDIINYVGQMNIGDFIAEDGFEYNSSNNPETNSGQFLFYILESKYNISIPQNVKELLLGEVEYKDLFRSKQDPETIKGLIDKIQDEETKRLLNEMKEDKEIKSVDDVKDVLFIKTIIEEAYREQMIPQEIKNDSREEQEL